MTGKIQLTQLSSYNLNENFMSLNQFTSNGSKRTISASGRSRLLQMVSESDIEWCASEDAWPLKSGFRLLPMISVPDTGCASER